MTYKASKEVILIDLSKALNEASETMFENYDGDVFAVGVVCSRDRQILFTGPANSRVASGIMLVSVKSVGKELKIFTDEEVAFLEKMVLKFKEPIQ